MNIHDSIYINFLLVYKLIYSNNRSVVGWGWRWYWRIRRSIRKFGGWCMYSSLDYGDGFMCVCVCVWKFIKLHTSNVYSLLCNSSLLTGSVMSDSLRPCGLQHSRLPCSSPTPGACSDSCPLNWWRHPTISSSSPPALKSFPASGFYRWVSSSHQVAKVLEFQL